MTVTGATGAPYRRASAVGRAAFQALLTLALVVRVLLVVATPFGQTVAHRIEGLNDEPAQLNYVRYLTEHRALPVQRHSLREPGAFERGDYEYYQPPLYYIVCAPLVAAAGGPRAALYACRLVSFAFGVLSLIVIGRIFGLLGCTPSCRRLGVVFVALLPTHAYFSSLTSNDSLSWLIALMILHQLLVLLGQDRRGAGAPRVGFDARLGLLIAAGLLTKTSIAVFLPLIVLAYLWMGWQARRPRVTLAMLIPLGLVLLCAGPWYWRNLTLYGSLSAFAVGFGPPEPGLVSRAGIVHTIKACTRYFWFPMQHVPNVPPVVAVRYLEAALTALHGVAAAVFLVRARAGDVKAVATALLLGAVALGQLIMGFMWSNVEGRYLLPALAPIAYLIVAPVVALTARWRGGERLAWAYVCLLAAHPWALLAFA
jgi:4-amino-4-deoxy-L-arabinose transferase-like glycosyltransferase